MSGETDAATNGSFLARPMEAVWKGVKRSRQIRYTLGGGMNQICGLIEFVKGGVCVCVCVCVRSRAHARMHTDNSQFLTWGLNSDTESTGG